MENFLKSMKKYTSVILIPVGPGTNTLFLVDTIESIKKYCSHYKIILINDSQKKIDPIFSRFNCDEIITPRPMGKQSGLFFSLCMGIAYALKTYDFQVILRMDDDALICGNSPEKDAIKYFNLHQDIGILGSYKTTWNGEKRSFHPPKKEILIETSPVWKALNFFHHKKSGDILPIIKKAQRNGYQLGEHVLGGVYFMSRLLIEKLNEKQLLACKNFSGSRLEEDHIFGILTYVVGMKLGDFVTGEYPMCLKWRGMPTSPQQIYSMKKKVIHSTRFFENLDEQAVRAELKKLRAKDLNTQSFRK